MIAAAVIPTMAFATMAINLYAEAELRQHDLQKLTSVRAISEAIDRQLEIESTLLRALRSLPAAEAGDWATLYDRALRMVVDQPVTAVVLYDANGQQVFNTQRPYGETLPPPRSPERVREIARSGVGAVSDLVYGTVSQSWQLGVFLPIARSGQVTNVLAIGFEPKLIQQVLDRQRVPAGWLMSVIDGKGRIVARSGPNAGQTSEMLGRSANPDYLARVQLSVEGSIEAPSIEGRQMRAAFSRSSLSGWTVGIAVEADAALVSLNDSLWLMVVGGLAILIGALGVSIRLARRTTREIVELTHAASALGRGERVPKLTEHLTELSELTTAIVSADALLAQRTADNLAATEKLEKRTEELHASEARYRLLAENARDMILFADGDGVARYVSPSSESLLGYDPDFIRGRALSRFVHDDDAPLIMAFLKKVGAGVREFEFRHRMRRKNGETIWVELSARTLFAPETGEPTGFIAGIRDVTAKRAAEDHAAQATQLAESSNRAKSDFLANMSHELRTPLNAVIGFSQLLTYSSASNLTDKQREYVSFIARAGEHLLQLVTDLLDLAKIESGRLRVSIESVQCDALLDEVRDLIKPVAAKAGVDLQFGPQRFLWVRADRSRLIQVLLNLCSNAIKYNREDGVVTVLLEPRPDGWVRFLVRDTGVGISTENQARIFQPFQRFDRETAIEGSGIGLSISQRLIQLMGARIGFNSEFGKGSEFWVELPETSPDREDFAQLEVTGAEDRLSEQKGFTLLYVDDNPASVALMAGLAAELPNVRLISAPSGRIGVELAIAHRPDVIVLDIHMPDLNGYDVLDLLRAAPETREIPVLALSADAMPREVERGRKAGFVDYMTKPFDFQRLLATIEQVLERRSASEAASIDSSLRR